MKKKLILIALMIAAFTFDGISQSIEITPYVGYTFGGRVYGRYGELKVRSSESFGGALAIVMPHDVAIQFEYFRQPTVGEYRDYYDFSFNQTVDLDIDWYQLGFLKQVPMSDKMVPFGGLSLGATYFNLKSDPGIDQLSFSIALQGGVKLYLSDRIGLRLHARMLMPIQWGGFGFYAGSGGSGASVNAGTYFIQGDVGAGLIIRLGN